MKRPHLKYSVTQRDGLHYDDWLRAMPLCFDRDGTPLYAGRNSLRIMTLPDGSKAVVKRHTRPNRVKRIQNTLHGQSKGRRAYDNALALADRALDTPPPVAYVEESLSGVFQRSYYVYRVDYGCTLVSLLMHCRDDADATLALVDSFAAFVARMHEQGVVHQDINPGNVLCHRRAGTDRWTFSLIDINRVNIMPQGTHPTFRECVDSIVHLPSEPKFGFEQFAVRYLRHRHLFTFDNLDQILNAKRRHDVRYRTKKRLLHGVRGAYYHIVDHR